MTAKHENYGEFRQSRIALRGRVASALSLSSGPRNALDLAGAGCLQLAEAVASRLLGILITFPLELGLQALPLIGVNRFEIGVRELAARSRLNREQRRVGPVNAQLGRLLCLDVNPSTRRQANRRCPDLAVNPFEIAVSCAEVTTGRIARASA